MQDYLLKGESNEWKVSRLLFICEGYIKL